MFNSLTEMAIQYLIIAVIFFNKICK